MKIQGNYPILLNYVREASELRRTNPLLSLFLKEKTDKFFSNNAIRIQTAHEKTTAIMDKYIERDNEGNFKTENNQFVFKTEQDKKDYEDAWDEMAKLTFDIMI